MSTFKLDHSFINEFIGKQPKWGPVGYVTYKRTYARPLTSIHENHAELARVAGLQSTEEFWLTLVRVVEGCFGVQEAHCKSLRLPWDPNIAQHKAQEMYRLMWEFKFSPPGRGFWMMGAPAVDKLGGAALFNCGMVSTRDIAADFSGPFCFLMDFSMLGVGVGFDVLGAGTMQVKEPAETDEIYIVGDTREGWVDLLRMTLDAFVGQRPLYTNIDVSGVRSAGSPIRGFGGTASGPRPLLEMQDAIITLLRSRIGHHISVSDITDVMNLIGRCVVSGNVRRSAEIGLGEDTDDYLDLKDRDKHPVAVDGWRWASNNSIFAKIGQSYRRSAARTARNGEPGYQWMENAQHYGRMSDPRNDRDILAVGVNPCQPAWATVLTPRGIRTIGDITVGDTVWSGEQWTKVTNKWSTGIKQVKGYHTTAGSFYGTENHRIMQHGKKIEVGQAESIDASTGPEGSPEKLDLRAVVNGLVFGDGTWHEASRRVFLCSGEEEMVEYRREFGDLVGVFRPGVSTATYEVSTEFDTLPHTYERIIPEKYLHGAAELKCAFLRGLYTANGSVVANRVTLKAASLEVIRGVQMMLSSLGIRSYYTTNKPADVQHANGLYTSRQSYDLNISTKEGRRLFATLIGFVQAHKMTRLQAIEDHGAHTPKVTFDIQAVEDISVEEVFDMTVEADEHTYWTGGLLVSNCAEQTLEDRELCNLVETYPANHDSLVEYLRTLKFAYLYAKTVTLMPTHDQRVNAVTMKNRRIGCSMSGITQAVAKFGYREFLRLCDAGYEEVQSLDFTYSNWLCVPRSIKTTSVKPSGTVSLLCGATPGIHYPESEFYWRVIRFATNSPLLAPLRVAGYRCVEIAPTKEPNTTAVYFPVKEANFRRAKSDVSMWEQLLLASDVQAHWADNQVSATVTFDKRTEGPQIERALEVFETRLKGVSFLPREDHGYDHAPYQPMTEGDYEAAVTELRPLDLSDGAHEVTDAYCDGDKCTLALSKT